jgi:hypothetical protein
MPTQTLRFGVFDGADLRAATWRCWSPHGKEDVYLSCRELGSVFKTSLHESGQWHVAYDNNFFTRNVREEDKSEKGRFITKWAAPQPIAPGVQLAFRIITSCSSVCTPYTNVANIIQLPKPAEGTALEIDILIVEPTVKLIPEWPGKDNMNTSLVGSFQLPSGRTVWIVYWEIPVPAIMTNQLTGRVKYYEGYTREDMNIDGLKVLVFGEEPDGSRTFYDYKVLRIQPVDATH